MSQEPASPAKEKTYLHLSPADWVKYALGLASGLLLGVLVFWLNSKSPYLRSTTGETVTFQGEQQQFGVIGLTVINDGSKEAEDVTCSFALKEAKILDAKVTTPASQKPKPEINKEKNEFSVRIGTLNPTESFQVAAMVNNPEKVPKKVDFKVRGRGVVAVERKADEPDPFWGTVMFSAFVIIATLGYAYSVTERRKRSRPTSK